VAGMPVAGAANAGGRAGGGSDPSAGGAAAPSGVGAAGGDSGRGGSFSGGASGANPASAAAPNDGVGCGCRVGRPLANREAWASALLSLALFFGTRRRTRRGRNSATATAQ